MTSTVGVVKGLVKATSGPLDAAAITVYARNAEVAQSTRIEADGAFWFDLAPGVYDFTVTFNMTVGMKSEVPVTAGNNPTIEIEIK